MRMRAFAHVVRAEFLDRTRRHGFLVTLGVTLYAAYTFLPPLEAPYVTLVIGGHRGRYDSAWVGCSVAMLTSAFLSIAGFYLVKNAIERDRRTGVGAILASTPLTKPLYTLGKAASNFAVLAILTLLLAAGAVGMQLLRGEVTRIDVLALVLPFVIVTLPAMAVVAGMAVLFEAVPALRGGLGNAVYVFVWSGMMAGALAKTAVVGIGDMAGTAAVLPQMIDASARAFHDVNRLAPDVNLGISFRGENAPSLTTFDWHGPQWTWPILLGRLAWVGIGVMLGLLAAVPFDRFESDRQARRWRPAKQARPDPPAVQPGSSRPPQPAIDIARAVPRASGLPWLVAGELGLLLRGRPWGWWLVAVALAIACWLAPLAFVTRWLLPLAWIWPLLVWSPMGAREELHGTTALIVSSPRWLIRQLAAAWLAGFTVAAVIGAGAGVRQLIAGDARAAAAWLAAAALPPSLAMACGAWTKNGRMFEVVYLLLVYVGPINGLPALDFVGAGGQATGSGLWSPAVVWGSISLSLLLVAAAGRARSDPYLG